MSCPPPLQAKREKAKIETDTQREWGTMMNLDSIIREERGCDIWPIIHGGQGMVGRGRGWPGLVVNKMGVLGASLLHRLPWRVVQVSSNFPYSHPSSRPPVLASLVPARHPP
eukprot:8660221-Pyramimonas_sp.AAC.1